MTRLLLVGLAPAWVIQAAVPADSGRGERLFETLACVQCHGLNGKGGSTAPDLGRLVDRDLRPAALAATMWNHAPSMWESMRTRGIGIGDLDSQAAADLFAYFYSTRFFERPGDAGRGKRLFSEKRCSECHGIADSKTPTAKPVAQWESLGHPIALVSATWNHAAAMREDFSRRNWSWPELNAQELGDILVYLRGLPAARNAPVHLEINAGSEGEALFQSKGCAACHTAKLTLTARLKGETLTDIGVAMWSHASKMATNTPRLEVDEMRDLPSYLWADQFFQDSGDLSAGRRVFKDRHCASCHNDPSTGAPQLPRPGQSFTSSQMVSALWHHGPQMQEKMKSKAIAWPRFSGKEMADLVGYLNSSGKAK